MASKIEPGVATPPEIDSKVAHAATSSTKSSDDGLPTYVEGSPESRELFLASFSAEENHRIMRKVDRKFLLIIGMMYILKNIDYQNAALAKVLQVGQPRNIMTELKMTAEEYNWVQSIYFVCYYLFKSFHPSND